MWKGTVLGLLYNSQNISTNYGLCVLPAPYVMTLVRLISPINFCLISETIHPDNFISNQP
jgi:hypothetical protein